MVQKNLSCLSRICTFLLAGMFILGCSDSLNDLPKSADEVFVINRGTNISHWLSQSDRRGEARKAWFTEQDVAFIASLGFDHIRIPIDEEQMWDEQGNKEAGPVRYYEGIAGSVQGISGCQHLKACAGLPVRIFPE